MIPLVLIRHGPTAWNAEGRIQGRSDEPLSPEGQAEVQGWCLPEEFQGYRWRVSPLSRARQTAALLGHEDAEVDARLLEADWGAWEGARLAELRAELGAEMAATEARGLDFTPPGGESPRDLQRRLAPFLAELAAAGEASVAVAHKGVIRALYALASGWDMTGKPPQKLQNACAQVFTLKGDGDLGIDRLNIRLAP